MHRDGCVFCSIVAGEAPASVVHSDDGLLAFLDLRPVNPGHLLVVPTEHVVGLADLDGDTGARMWRLGHRLAGALRRSGLRCDGVNLFLADGAAAGQEVFHVHLHVFPRFPGDGFRLRGGRGVPARATLDETAAAIQAGL